MESTKICTNSQSKKASPQIYRINLLRVCRECSVLLTNFSRGHRPKYKVLPTRRIQTKSYDDLRLDWAFDLQLTIFLPWNVKTSATAGWHLWRITLTTRVLRYHQNTIQNHWYFVPFFDNMQWITQARFSVGHGSSQPEGSTHGGKMYSHAILWRCSVDSRPDIKLLINLACVSSA